jgi:hypothetical protein
VVHPMRSCLCGTPNGIRTRTAALKGRFSASFDLGFWHSTAVSCPTSVGPRQPVACVATSLWHESGTATAKRIWRQDDASWVVELLFRPGSLRTGRQTGPTQCGIAPTPSQQLLHEQQAA